MSLKGTDYYLVKNSFLGLRDATRKHLGRSVSGWCFFLHIYPRDKVFTWGDMKLYLNEVVDNGYKIVNTHGMVVTLDNFVEIVEERQRIYRPKRDPEWFKENFAKSGPNGLARHKVDGYLCVGNGDGPYDYMLSDFFSDFSLRDVKGPVAVDESLSGVLR